MFQIRGVDFTLEYSGSELGGTARPPLLTHSLSSSARDSGQGFGHIGGGALAQVRDAKGFGRSAWLTVGDGSKVRTQ